MPIIVGYIPTAEGEAALAQAVIEAQIRSQRLIVVVSSNGKHFEPVVTDSAIDSVRERLAELKVSHEIRQVDRGADVTTDIVTTATEVDAEMIVIGLRKRSPLGKLILGSNAQRILLDAPCPVLAIKPAPTQ